MDLDERTVLSNAIREDMARRYGKPEEKVISTDRISPVKTSYLDTIPMWQLREIADGLGVSVRKKTP
ncbi:MAG: hypothetical protein M3Q24_01535 [bacterium]|nr:hypothetical protein [bacterium]